MCKLGKWKLSDDDKLKIKDYTIEKAAQYAAILAELRHERGIYDKSIYIVRDMALAMAGDCESIQGIAEHYQKIIKVYDATIDDMMREFNEVMQLDFPELEGAEDA